MRQQLSEQRFDASHRKDEGEVMQICKVVAFWIAVLASMQGESFSTAADLETWDGKIVQHGKMHEAIGAQQHQGRVRLKDLIGRPHFYAVAALEELKGEATILDGKITISRVGKSGQIESSDEAIENEHATLLVGAYVPSWTNHKFDTDVETDDLDQHIAEMASKAGFNLSEPFVFTIEGTFGPVDLHVINGACPMHARLKKIELPEESRPLEIEWDRIQGTVVGVFAKDSVGNMTHPATSSHMHLVFKDDLGQQVTGHIEKLGVRAGSILRLPKRE